MERSVRKKIIFTVQDGQNKIQTQGGNYQGWGNPGFFGERERERENQEKRLYPAYKPSYNPFGGTQECGQTLMKP